jgi:cell wall assembly regulator SMI1
MTAAPGGPSQFRSQIVVLAEQIVAWHRRHQRRTADLLRPGLSVAALDAFEEALGVCLPAEFRALYGWRDGMMRGPLAQMEF